MIADLLYTYVNILSLCCSSSVFSSFLAFCVSIYVIIFAIALAKNAFGLKF